MDDNKEVDIICLTIVAFFVFVIGLASCVNHHKEVIKFQELGYSQHQQLGDCGIIWCKD